MDSQAHEVTDLLLAWNEGDPEALNTLMSLVYEELHQQARRFFEREHESRTLQPTVLLHEVYLRLVDAKRVEWDNRLHFFGAVSRLMRQILVDAARSRNAVKRGNGVVMVPLDEALGLAVLPEVDLILLDEALTRLATMDARQCRIIELRFFAGLTIPETAEVLEIGTATVIREWRTAKAWLLKEIRRSGLN